VVCTRVVVVDGLLRCHAGQRPGDVLRRRGDFIGARKVELTQHLGALLVNHAVGPAVKGWCRLAAAELFVQGKRRRRSGNRLVARAAAFRLLLLRSRKDDSNVLVLLLQELLESFLQGSRRRVRVLRALLALVVAALAAARAVAEGKDILRLLFVREEGGKGARLAAAFVILMQECESVGKAAASSRRHGGEVNAGHGALETECHGVNLMLVGGKQSRLRDVFERERSRDEIVGRQQGRHEAGARALFGSVIAAVNRKLFFSEIAFGPLVLPNLRWAGEERAFFFITANTNHQSNCRNCQK